MKLFSIFSAAWLGLAALISAHAAGPADKEEAAQEKLISSLKFQEGVIPLLSGKAQITLKPGFQFLNNSDTRKVIVELWNNPPGAADDALGMIVPKEATPRASLESWAAVVSWKDDGYVKDEEFSSINFDDMLKTLKESSREFSKERMAQGYGKLEIVGWAQQPRYETSTHKLYWAKAIDVGGPIQELHYDIRFLGRAGVLELSIMSDLPSLKEIEAKAPAILSMVDFTEGNRYADYKAGDKVAAYGIGGLIAGGVLAKTGFFKVLLIGLAKFWKLIAIAVVAIGALISKLVGAKRTRLGE